MKCPKCGEEMVIKSVDTSADPDTGKHYDRTHYQCVADDVWIKVEIPR